MLICECVRRGFLIKTLFEPPQTISRIQWARAKAEVEDWVEDDVGAEATNMAMSNSGDGTVYDVSAALFRT